MRRHGGLTVADEVQVGYGRLGHWFWGFEQQQVGPDIVCVAKAKLVRAILARSISFAFLVENNSMG